MTHITLTLTPTTLPVNYFYHRSNELFDSIDLTILDKGNQFTSTHPNSSLGIWCSTFPNRCSGFGKYNYKICFDSKLVNVCFVNYGNFVKFCNAVDKPKETILESRLLFSQIRSQLVSNYIDILVIRDSLKYIGEVIICNMDIITKIKNMDEHVEDYHISDDLEVRQNIVVSINV